MHSSDSSKSRLSSPLSDHTDLEKADAQLAQPDPAAVAPKPFVVDDTGADLEAAERRIAHLEARLQDERDRHRKVEEQLRLSEDKYRRIVEEINEVIYAADARGTLTYVSPAVEGMLDYRPDELIGRQITDYIHPDDRTRAISRLRQVLVGRTVTNEYRILTRSGAVRWVRTSSKPLMAEGKAIGVQGVVTDITEQRSARQEVVNQNKFLTDVLESLTHPFYVVDAEDYSIQMANSAARKAGLTTAGTCYSLTHGLCAPCSEHGLLCPIEEIKRSGRPVSVEHVHHDPDGTPHYVEVNGYPLFDEQGKVARVIEYTVDVTSRRQAELALRRSEALLRETQTLAGVGGWELDLVAGRLAWTDEVYAIYEAPPDFEPTLETALSFYDPRDRPTLEQAIRRAMETGRPWDLELRLHAGSGELRWVRAIGNAEWQDGSVARLSGTIQDVTERRQTAEALQKAKEAAEQAQNEERERRRESERRREIAERLAEVMAVLNSNESLEQILSHIAAQAGRLLACQAVTIYRLNSAGTDFIAEPIQGMPGDLMPNGNVPIVQVALRQAVAEGRAVQVIGPPSIDTVGDSDLADTDAGAQSTTILTAVPVLVRDEAFGALLLNHAEAKTIPPDVVDVATAFATQVALAVESARLREQIKQTAATTERQRLARELHDSVTQNLFSASLLAEILPQLWQRDPEQAMEGLEKLRYLTRGALAEMRGMLLELRPSAVLDSHLQDLVRQLIEGLTGRVAVTATSHLEPIPKLPSAVQVTFYRVAQEALQNVIKHARAGQVTVNLGGLQPIPGDPVDERPVGVRLSVVDDGMGFDPGSLKTAGLGLGIMKERAESIGGRLTVMSSPGQGTEVVLTWPGGHDEGAAPFPDAAASAPERK